MVYWLPYSSYPTHHPSLTPCLPWIYYVTQKLMLDSLKMVEKQSEAFHTFLWHFFQMPDCIFEIHQLWQSGLSRVYSKCCCSCSFEPEIIKIGEQSHMMYSYNILNFQESQTILNEHTKKVLKRIVCTSYICIYMQISLNIIDILCLHIFFWIRSNSLITFIVFGGIDLCIVHSCMYP